MTLPAASRKATLADHFRRELQFVRSPEPMAIMKVLSSIGGNVSTYHSLGVVVFKFSDGSEAYIPAEQLQ